MPPKFRRSPQRIAQFNQYACPPIRARFQGKLGTASQENSERRLVMNFSDEFFTIPALALAFSERRLP